ncbi:Oidioi.mRNA.OKI2018_I69.PAR.g11541.t1.cds [Oikopleura dioica]|uniref:Oidioi.mRNA.OKI2018_I69.PAR.g11541.t1.cds n=1 Tax=Oikopleura dioica TaxID=34765 RepID=A0ABN7S0X0_OIKDI|nr:Oidioi.mRNA.OKI2018_I69.PAR.g11541.t1.cds [Oikopleura dioica]
MPANSGLALVSFATILSSTSIAFPANRSIGQSLGQVEEFLLAFEMSQSESMNTTGPSEIMQLSKLAKAYPNAFAVLAENSGYVLETKRSKASQCSNFWKNVVLAVGAIVMGASLWIVLSTSLRQLQPFCNTPETSTPEIPANLTANRIVRSSDEDEIFAQSTPSSTRSRSRSRSRGRSGRSTDPKVPGPESIMAKTPPPPYAPASSPESEPASPESFSSVTPLASDDSISYSSLGSTTSDIRRKMAELYPDIAGEGSGSGEEDNVPEPPTNLQDAIDAIEEGSGAIAQFQDAMEAAVFICKFS